MIKNIFEKARQDSLFLNSIYLMLGTGVMSGFGFFFWLICAHLLPPEDIGIATTLISAMNTIALLSLIGFDSAIIRFLSRSTEKNDKLNTGLILVGSFSAILSIIFVVFVHTFSPHLAFIQDNNLMKILFVIFCITSSLNILTDSVFLSYRKTIYTLVINTLFSFVKMILPIIFVFWGAFGIFTAAALGQTLGFFLSIVAMMIRFDYKPEFVINKKIIKDVWNYCLGNYTAGVLNLLPITVLPIIISNRIGTKEAGYFYIVTMIVNLLYAIPQATSRSLFAESSHDENSLSLNIKKTFKIIFGLLIPSILVLVFGGKYLLMIFNEKNMGNGNTFLSIMALSAIVVCFNSIMGSFFRVQKKISYLIVISIVYSSSTIGLTYLLSKYGLVGVGIAWFTGTSLSSLVGFFIYRYFYTINTHKILSRLPYWTGFDDRLGELNQIVNAKYHFLLSFIKNGFKIKKILFYPEKPNKIHSAYQIAGRLGCIMTSKIDSKAEAVFNFMDTTVRDNDQTIIGLNKNNKVINFNCTDISKERVDKIFGEVFGYNTFIDPRTFVGECVKKSSKNATHDGKIIKCPVEPEPGYVYQKFINSKNGDDVEDIRLVIIGQDIPLVIKRYKSCDDKFDKSHSAKLMQTRELLSEEEIEKVLEFTKRFGLDCGEIDSMRDIDDGKLYIVDVNNTPSGPKPGRALTRTDYNFMVNKITKAFYSAFLS